MKFKLNKEYIKSNGGERVSFGRFSKFRGVHDFSQEETVKSASKNQELLEELYNMGKPYVDMVSSPSKSKKKIKKVCKDDPKETNCEQKEKQVLPETSEE
jgi:hypothetical protein